MTSFYEPEDGTIYALEGETAVFQVSMLRSLTTALLDQELQWSDHMAELNDAQRVGYRALIDGVANRVVAAKVAEEPELGTQHAADLVSREQAVGVVPGGVSFAADGYLASAVTGVDVPVAEGEDTLANVVVPANDAIVLDPARDATAVPSTVPMGTTGTTAGRVLGMQFWYEAMLPVLGADSARSAALLWVDDNSAVSNVANHPCVSSQILTASEPDKLALANYLTQWAAARPPSSTATVTTEGGNLVTISICQATEDVTAPMSPTDVPDLYELASLERAYLTQMLAIQLPDTAAARQCAVFALRGDSVPNFSVGSTDPTMAAAMTNVVTFCKGA